ncbi:MAG TPA: c-type cytochrome [Gaiellaceae bacterium]|nr:c-type cytochrome [Gaiellaceae bacterium]
MTARLLAAAAVLLLTGCAGSRSAARGRAIFERSCAGCHTLTGRDTDAPGGDLRAARLSAGAVASFARVMPVHPPLTAADARAVGRYVASR